MSGAAGESEEEPKEKWTAFGQGKSKKHRPQLYRKEWGSQPNFAGWPKPGAGSGKAFRRCCNGEPVAEITVLKNHSKAKRHKEKEKNLASTQRPITLCVQKTWEREKLETAVKTAEVKLAGFLAEHISSRVTDHLLDVIKDIFKDSKTAQNMSLGHTKGTKHLIGECYFESLSEILTRKKSSVLIDESTDIGNVKTLCDLDEGTNRVQTHILEAVADLF